MAGYETIRTRRRLRPLQWNIVDECLLGELSVDFPRRRQTISLDQYAATLGYINPLHENLSSNVPTRHWPGHPENTASPEAFCNDESSANTSLRLRTMIYQQGYDNIAQWEAATAAIRAGVARQAGNHSRPLPNENRPTRHWPEHQLNTTSFIAFNDESNATSYLRLGPLIHGQGYDSSAQWEAARPTLHAGLGRQDQNHSGPLPNEYSATAEEPGARFQSYTQFPANQADLPFRPAFTQTSNIASLGRPQTPARQPNRYFYDHQAPFMQSPSYLGGLPASAIQNDSYLDSFQTPSMEPQLYLGGPPAPVIQNSNYSDSQQDPSMQQESFSDGYETPTIQPNSYFDSVQTPSMQPQLYLGGLQAPEIQNSSYFDSQQDSFMQQEPFSDGHEALTMQQGNYFDSFQTPSMQPQPYLGGPPTPVQNSNYFDSQQDHSKQQESFSDGHEALTMQQGNYFDSLQTPSLRPQPFFDGWQLHGPGYPYPYHGTYGPNHGPQNDYHRRANFHQRGQNQDHVAENLHGVENNGPQHGTWRQPLGRATHNPLETDSPANTGLQFLRPEAPPFVPRNKHCITRGSDGTVGRGGSGAGEGGEGGEAGEGGGRGAHGN